MDKKLAFKRIEDIEADLEELKRDLRQTKSTQLSGLWKTAKVEEKDLQKAEDSLFDLS